VLTGIATLIQIASWIWPASRDWVDSHGLLFAVGDCALLVALVVALRRRGPGPGSLLSVHDMRTLDVLDSLLPAGALAVGTSATQERKLREFAELCRVRPVRLDDVRLRLCFQRLAGAVERATGARPGRASLTGTSGRNHPLALRAEVVAAHTGFWEIAAELGYPCSGRAPQAAP
jgi:hypothetical protein